MLARLQVAIEGHSAKQWQDPMLSAPCHAIGHFQMLRPHVFGRSSLAALVCTFTFNYKAQQRRLVGIWAPVGWKPAKWYRRLTCRRITDGQSLDSSLPL